ncbi:hypothetical protein MN205_02685 [Kineococcus sp. TRM81007]|uniref:hypothetical protein n=1 Tax=Kineococcus sp. TRM81007 TaxID=2925831 RepID=UPI001F5953B6|nr:hypothetical protein [Kineococcus sp. TRM81007]MCI2237396.1 hypothetical protein [Kineococcus sp. TRM81007]
MVSDNREHDAFGPWVDEVHTPQDVPRLYRDHPLNLDDTRLVLKVPRNITRREATAETDLYEHLLVVQAELLTVLSRHQSAHETPTGRPGGYRTRQVALHDIVAVRDEVDLLDGHLHVHTRDGGVLSLSYNGSARERVQRLIDELRTGPHGHHAGAPRPIASAQRTAPGAGAEELTIAALSPDDVADVAVVADYLQVARQRPDLIALAWHGRQVLRPRLTGLVGALHHLPHPRSPVTLQAALLARDGTHLEVFGRRERLVRGQRPVHSSSRLLLPLRTLDRVRARPNPRYRRATDVTLQAGDAHLHLTVPTGSLAERLLRVSATWPSS